MDIKKKISSLVDYDDEEEHDSKSRSHSQSSLHSNKIKSQLNFDKRREKVKDEKHWPQSSRESRHSPHLDRDSKSGSDSKIGSKGIVNNSCISNYHNRNERQTDRRHDNKPTKDTNEKSKRSDFYDRRDTHRKDDEKRRDSRRRHQSRSRSRSRERRSHQSSSRRDERPKYEPRNETKSTARTQNMNNLQTINEQIKASTGVTVPTYYNPGVVNPIKFAQQEQKRKLLWSREEDKKVEESKQQKKEVSSSVVSPYNNLQFEDQQKCDKFRKLMGIKNNCSDASTSVIANQETLFRNLDKQYEIARQTTHTQRGVGLGFGLSQSLNQ